MAEKFNLTVLINAYLCGCVEPENTDQSPQDDHAMPY